MINDLPLAGLNIAVTRPRAQAAELVRGIEKLGGACIQFPLLEITPLADDQILRQFVARLHEFQLAIFISPNAVRYGMEVIHLAGGLPASLQIATVGLSSAQALHDYGVKKVIAPQQKFDSEALLELAEMHNVRGMRVAIFRGDKGHTMMPKNQSEPIYPVMRIISFLSHQEPSQQFQALYSPGLIQW